MSFSNGNWKRWAWTMLWHCSRITTLTNQLRTYITHAKQIATLHEKLTTSDKQLADIYIYIYLFTSRFSCIRTWLIIHIIPPHVAREEVVAVWVSGWPGTLRRQAFSYVEALIEPSNNYKCPIFLLGRYIIFPPVLHNAAHLCLIHVCMWIFCLFLRATTNSQHFLHFNYSCISIIWLIAAIYS